MPPARGRWEPSTSWRSSFDVEQIRAAGRRPALPSWTDAKAGAVVNLVVVAGAFFGYLSHGPGSLRASFEEDVAREVFEETATSLLVEADLGRLPEPVQRYLRVTGVVGQPRVASFQARTAGRIRSGRDARWISLSTEQHNAVAGPMARHFYFTGSMMALPVQGYHRYAGPLATMRVKAAALVPVADAVGPEMDQSETVTLFNDMCLFAPGSLVSQAITWEPIDRKHGAGGVHERGPHDSRGAVVQ